MQAQNYSELNESKKTIDDFTLRLKFIDAKNEETDSNFGVIQERFNYNEEKINSIEGYNEAFGNQIKNKFDEVELKFEEELKNFDILEKNNEEIINQILKNFNSTSSNLFLI